jgi:DeoR/GlpR family transcriptional regulator of sugar metabolism
MQVLDRKDFILKQLDEKSSVSVIELSGALGLSEVTVRKILASLEQDGCLRRTWGGAACAAGSLREPSHNEKVILHLKEKQAIAREAYDCIHNGDAVFLDCGTTTLELAKLIVSGPKRNILVCTNSIHVAMELSGAPDIHVTVIGGELRSNIYSCVGSIAEKTLQQLFFDKGFISGNHFSVEHGFTTPIFQEADLKRRAISGSKEKYFLIDSSKYGDDSLVLVAPPEQIDILITDWHAPDDLVRGFSDCGVRVIVAQGA